jgi:hypothetical protein
MFNTNSPIINNMNQGQPAYGCPPPNPIGNIVNIGNVGYYGNTNTGYYSGNYNNRFNPYIYRQQQEAMIAQQREDTRNQADMFKGISRVVHKAIGDEVSEDYLNKKYDPVYEQQEKMDEDEYAYNTLMNMQMQGREIIGNPYAIQQIINSNAYCDEQKRRFPDDISVAEFHGRAYELVLDAYMDKKREEERNLGQLYNKNEYNKLINMHSKSSQYFNSIMKMNGNTNLNSTIDDMTVSIPNHLASEATRRRAAFLASILEGK